MKNHHLPNFDVLGEIKRVLTIEGQAILACVERIEKSTSAHGIQKGLSLLYGALSRGGKVVVTGVGKSGKVAQKIAATLNSTGNFAVFLHPTEGLHGDLGVIVSGDVVLALSYTGNTEELIRLLPSLKSRQIPVVAITGNSQSKLAQQSDAWIDGFVTSEACPHNLAPTSSTTLALAIGDAIVTTLMQMRGFDPLAFARNHPGGSLGNRLSLQVMNVMHTGDQIPCLGLTVSMDEVVMVLTQFKMGGVFIVSGENNQNLLGVITEGDIRRALQHREKFFSLKAGDVMTRQPVTVAPEMLAIEALDLMRNRPSQISVLPVVDGQGKLQGILRLLDLVQIF